MLLTIIKYYDDQLRWFCGNHPTQGGMRNQRQSHQMPLLSCRVNLPFSTLYTKFEYGYFPMSSQVQIEVGQLIVLMCIAGYIERVVFYTKARFIIQSALLCKLQAGSPLVNYPPSPQSAYRESPLDSKRKRLQTSPKKS